MSSQKAGLSLSTLELKLIFMELFDWTKDREGNNLQQLWNGMLIN